MMRIFVRNSQFNTTTTLNVKSCETICSVKRKLKEKEGIRSDFHVGLIYNGKLLEDERTLAQCEILEESTLRLFLSQDALVETWCLLVKNTSGKSFILKVKNRDTIDEVKVKIQEKEGIPPRKQMLFLQGEWLEDGSRTIADYHICRGGSLYLVIQIQQGPQPTEEAHAPQSKRPRFATRTTPTKATPALKDLMPESGTVLTELTQKNKELSSRCANLEAENKRIKEELVDMEAENKRTKEELTVLTHTNKVFSARCASYESQVIDLEVENNKIKDELMNTERKYYSGARAAGYAEGLKEGKKKWVKSVDFLRHLTDASMKYFNHGFDSCQKQAEQQGFFGQLNKDTALKDAPELKVSESNDQPEQNNVIVGTCRRPLKENIQAEAA